MSVNRFLDTNVLLYAISTAQDEEPKKQRARELLSTDDWGLSIQVLQEFYVNATREPRPVFSHQDAMLAVEHFLRRPVVAVDASLMREGLRLKKRFMISYWDAAIVAAAKILGAQTLYSEDLNHGQNYEGVTVLNPFR